MKVQVYPDYESLSRETASIIASYIRTVPDALVCLASGNTPVKTFGFLVDDVKAGRLSIERCTFVSLDEWIGIGPTIEGSCRQMMDRDFFVPLNINQKNIHFFNGVTGDPQKQCDQINELIRSRKGLDIMLVGIGMNGHIAMNEPGTSFDSQAHVGYLAEETKTVGQKYFARQTVLDQGMTLGLGHLAESKLPILMANGKKKATIVARALSEVPSPDLPASIIQRIPQALTLLDADAASDLS